MDRTMKRTIGLLFILVLSGCGTPETRYLSCRPRPAAIESLSYNVHDPFPDEDAGPMTGTRPRAFMKPYSDTRKDLDLRYLKAAYGFPQQQKYSLDSSPSGGVAQFPVQPIWRSPPGATPVATVPSWLP